MKRRHIFFASMGALAVGSLAVTGGIGPVGANGPHLTPQGGDSKIGRAIAFPHRGPEQLLKPHVDGYCQGSGDHDEHSVHSDDTTENHRRRLLS